MKTLATYWVATALALGAALAWAPRTQAQQEPLTPAQVEAYVALLFSDRAALQLQVDRLRLQLQQDDARAAAVDEYWKRWTGEK